MSEPLVECVPNFAGGRDRAVVEALLAAMRLPGVLLLDCAVDSDQNRAIATIAGPPAAVCEAAVRAAGVAAERIDLTRQTGSYPRIGATDVIPFVPLRGIGLGECAMLAREAADALWTRYGIPSYLYAAAASRPDRASLEQVRQGQFEGLREAVLRDARRRPDVGGPGLHPSAGASAVGARPLLIEYTVSLDTADIRPARAIARAVRSEISGLPGVKAIALLAEGVAQVSLTVTDLRQSSLHAVHTAVLQAARAGRTGLLRTELVGLMPEAAYQAGSIWIAALQASGSAFDPDRRILERLIQASAARSDKEVVDR